MRGGAGAHIHDRRTEIGFVVGQGREAGYIGGGNHRLDGKMTPLDRKHQIAGRSHVGGRHMHVETEALRQHAAGLAHPPHVVEGIAEGERMQHHAAVAHGMPAAGRQQPRNVAIADGGARDIDRGGEAFAAKPSGGDRNRNRFQMHPGGLLSHPDGVAD